MPDRVHEHGERITRPVADIIIPPGREPSRDVADLAASICTVGLLHPITIESDGTLVAGSHRLAACRLLGWHEVPVTVTGLTGKRAELAAVDENLCQAERTTMERSILLAERKRLRAEMDSDRPAPSGPVTVTGAHSSAFVRETARATGLSPASVERGLRIAEKITPATQEIIRGTPVANATRTLVSLARVPAADQAEAARVAVAQARAPRKKRPSLPTVQTSTAAAPATKPLSKTAEKKLARVIVYAERALEGVPHRFRARVLAHALRRPDEEGLREIVALLPPATRAALVAALGVAP